MKLQWTSKTAVYHLPQNTFAVGTRWTFTNCNGQFWLQWTPHNFNLLQHKTNTIWQFLHVDRTKNMKMKQCEGLRDSKFLLKDEAMWIRNPCCFLSLKMKRRGWRKVYVIIVVLWRWSNCEDDYVIQRIAIRVSSINGLLNDIVAPHLNPRIIKFNVNMDAV
jgi:hypothetical protein